MILSDSYDQDLQLENAYWLGQCAFDPNLDKLIGEADLFHIKRSQELSGCAWMASSACMPFLSIRD